jgi:HTH-type transcriptional regulator/antitoxin HigA
MGRRRICFVGATEGVRGADGEDRCGDSVMDATLIIVDGDSELARANAFVAALWNSSDPNDLARLDAQARLISAYERCKWPPRAKTTRDVLANLIDQHEVSRAEMAKLVGGMARFRDVMAGRKSLGFAAVKRLHARFGISTDVFVDAADVQASKAAAA